MSRERRLVFGEVAELYDEHRPVYPDRLVDDVVALAGLDGNNAVLEVGAGTGKATAMFAGRGIPIVAVEPSEEMGAVARRKLAAYRDVEFERADFEAWDPAGRQFPLVFSAQAWHWIEPSIGYAKVRWALAIDGILAAFWNRSDWARSPSRNVLIAAYQDAAPDVAPDTDPMHPARELVDEHERWKEQIADTDGLADVGARLYEWSLSYTADEYVGRLRTSSGVTLLDTAQRAALMDAVQTAILESGAKLTLPQSTQLCVARRTD